MKNSTSVEMIESHKVSVRNILQLNKHTISCKQFAMSFLTFTAYQQRSHRMSNSFCKMSCTVFESLVLNY